MPADIEEVLRRALAARADDVAPDPATWGKVESRIRRNRTIRVGMAGVAVGAVLVVALGVATLGGAARVEFEPADPAAQPRSDTAPSPRPTASAAPARGGPVCTSDDPVVVVAATAGGELVAVCSSGAQEQLVQTADAVDSEPAFSPDGRRIAFTRRPTNHGGQPRVVLLDVTTGEQTVVAKGYGAVFGPRGQLAWFRDRSGDGQQPIISIRSNPSGRTRMAFPVAAPGAGELSARHLVWDTGGTRLWWETRGDGPALWTSDLQTEGPATLPVDVKGRGGTWFLAPSAAAPEQVAVVAACCAGTDGELPTEGEFGTVTLTGQRFDAAEGRYERLSEPGAVPLGDLGTPLYSADAGALSVVAGDGGPRFTRGERPSWIVGDGAATALVDSGGRVDDLGTAWHGMAVNPTFAPAGAP